MDLGMAQPEFGLESSALESAWIQRLMTDIRKDHSDEGLQIPLRNLGLRGESGGEVGELETVQAMSKELLARINTKVGLDKSLIPGSKPCRGGARPGGVQRSPTGFGSFRVKVSNVKCRKPPLPPSSKGGNATSGEAHKRKERIAQNRWRVHGVDVRIERQHRDGTRKDLLAEFASRLDIKEKATPVGTYHIVSRSNKPSLIKDMGLSALPSLTPVVSPSLMPAAATRDHEMVGSTTASLTPEMLELEASGHSSVGARKEPSNPSSMEGNQSHSSETRTVSTLYCGSSPLPCPVPSSRSSEQEERCRTINQEAEACFITGKRSSSKETVPPNLVKRSRHSVQGVSEQQLHNASKEATLVGPWLNRWSVRNPNTKDSGGSNKLDGVKSAWEKKQTSLRAWEAPSAAALGLVGAAVRQLQPDSLRQSRIAPGRAEQNHVTSDS